MRRFRPCFQAMGLVALLTCSPATAQNVLFPDPTGGSPTPLLFLHPLVNYREDPRWIRDWERHLQSQNSLRVNVGSVSTDDFMTGVELHLTQPVNDHVRVLYDMHWWDASHVETDEPQHFLGFEGAVHQGLGLQAQVFPASDKEEVDVRFGALLHDATRQRYLRALVRWDDFLFGEKNDRGGRSEQVQTRFEWVGRWQQGHLEVFSEGSYGSAGIQSFPDSSLAPLVRETREGRGHSRSRLRWVPHAVRFLELELLHHRFERGFVQRGASEADTYDNEIVDLALRGVWAFDAPWLVRAEVHRLAQESTQRSGQSFDYQRDEWMQGVFVQWLFHEVQRLEVGYLSTFYEWSGSPEPSAVRQDGYVQKLKLAYLLAFSPTARLQVSLSHEPDPHRFGGGNVHMMMRF